MKKHFLYTLYLLLILMIGCKSNSKEVAEWSDQDITEWILASEWKTVLPFEPDMNMDQRIFVEQNLKNKSAWKAAFDFLQNSDFAQIKEGRYELSEDGTYATVTDYETKEPDAALYEAHRKYIDIQYVASGEEYIEILPLSAITEEQKYNEKDDILFFEDKTKGTLLRADKTRFFVFFPDDVHKPCLKIDTTGKVRKIVVKIPYE